MTAWILLNILVVFSISNCIYSKNFRTLSCAAGEISRKPILKKFIKNFQTNKNQFWVLLIGFSYLSQNSSFKSKNLVLYLKMFALQNGNIFIQIWKFDWARSGVVLVQWLLYIITVKRTENDGGRGGARNFLPGGLSPPNSNLNPDTKKFLTCFRKFSGWAQHPWGWAEPTPAHPWRRH